jgi:Xaa-Pro aminopeptidase
MLASDLRKRGLDAVLLTQAEPINWLLNLRGRDVERLPVVLGFAVLYANATMDFFVDTDKIDCFAFSQHVGQDVSVYPIDKLGDVLQRIGEDQQKVLADPNTANAWTQLVMEEAGAILVAGQDPDHAAQGVQEPVELAGMRAAHLRDGVAVTRFLAWLDRLIASGEFDGVDEGTLADQLEAFRHEQEHYVEPSFDTISALGPNAAMCHYRHTNGTPRTFGQDSIYLVDSGAQYLDGTTDITRTVKVGEVTDEHKAMFTRVLQGHIALDQARFPRGTAGIQLDVLARMPLWQAGYNYDHGTGHGVGHFLSVHEGPQRIAPKGSLVALQPGMVLSNEPGYYREDAFGIRCENLVVVTEQEQWRAADAGLRAADLCAVRYPPHRSQPAEPGRVPLDQRIPCRGLPPPEPAAGGRGSRLAGAGDQPPLMTQGLRACFFIRGMPQCPLASTPPSTLCLLLAAPQRPDQRSPDALVPRIAPCHPHRHARHLADRCRCLRRGCLPRFLLSPGHGSVARTAGRRGAGRPAAGLCPGGLVRIGRRAGCSPSRCVPKRAASAWPSK